MDGIARRSFITGDNHGQSALKTGLIVSTRFSVLDVRDSTNSWGTLMAAPKNLRILPDGRINGLSNRTVRAGREQLTIRQPAGPVLFLGGCTYAAAYLLLGLSGFSTWSGLLALAGTGLILFGLRRTWMRA